MAEVVDSDLGQASSPQGSPQAERDVGGVARTAVDGRWISYLRLPDGRKKFYSGRTRSQVKDLLTSAQRAHSEGLSLSARTPSLGAYLEGWLSGVVAPSVRPKTREDYELNVRRLLPLLGQVQLRSLTPEMIQQAYGVLLERGLSARTERQNHMVLRRALRQAVLWRLIPSNPTDAVRPPRPARLEMKVLREDEVRRLLETRAEAASTRSGRCWSRPG